eukprot:symbB.v1.2.003485.t3/scaffold198.1/size278664/1
MDCDESVATGATACSPASRSATTEDMPLNMGGQNVQLKIIRLHVGHILVFMEHATRATVTDCDQVVTPTGGK